MRHLAIAAIVLALAQAAFTAVPETMSYQGVLRDGTGTPVLDGTYSVTFSLYDAAVGGTELWTETQSISTSGGIFDAALGGSTPLTLPFDEPYWLSMQVESDPELAPRTELTSVPYAMRARYGELALPYSGSYTSGYFPAFTVENPSGPSILARSDITTDGRAAVRVDAMNGQMYAALGYMNSGTTWGVFTPHPLFAHTVQTASDITAGGDGHFSTTHMDELHLQTSPTDGYVLTSDASGYGTWQPPTEFTLPYSGSASSGSSPALTVENPIGPSILARSDLTVDGKAAIRADAMNGQMYGAFGFRSGGTTWGVFTPHPLFASSIQTGGSITAGTDGHFSTTHMDGFHLQTAPSDGYVLTSNASGYGTWQPPAAGSDGDWTVAGDDMYSGATGNVGVGTTTPEEKFHVRDEVTGGVSYAAKLDNPSGTAGTAVGVLFKVDGGIPSESRGKGALVYERTDTWNRGSFHFLQDSGVTYENPNIADAVMTIDNSGRVGIGTTTPAELLEVAGTVHSTSGGFKFPDGTVQTSTATGGLVLPYSGSTASADEVLDVSNDGTGIAIIGTHTSSGNYGRLGGPIHGVYGLTNVSSGAGVYAKHEGSGVAVYANSPNGTALEATSGYGSGVWASSSYGDAVGAITSNGRALYAEDADGKTAVLCDADYGVHADNTAGTEGHIAGGQHGVFGETSVGSGAGVYGKHNGTGVAVYANSANGTALEAMSGSGRGVWAVSSSSDAVSAITSNGRALYAEDNDGKTAVLCDADYGVHAANTAGTEGHIAGGQHGVYGEASAGSGAGVYGLHNGSGVAVYANAPNGTALEATSGSGAGIWATSSTGNAVNAISVTGYAGHFEGGIHTDGFEYPTGASDGYPLISDATGVASWQQLGPGGLADPMNFGAQTWDLDFTSGRLDMDITAGYPVLELENSSTSGYGGVALIRSTSTTVSSAGTRALRVTTQRGNAASFQKYISDGYSAVDIFADSSTGLGLYVSGTITSTAKSARGVETVRGTEPVFAAETVEPEIYDSGEASLSGGRASVAFDQLFTDAVSKEARVRVTVTPVGGWSALYIESSGPEGFMVRSADGDPDIEFFWTACGLCKDHAVARQITFPDPEDIVRVEREQRAALGS